jgi:hypothetical protein
MRRPLAPSVRTSPNPQLRTDIPESTTQRELCGRSGHNHRTPNPRVRLPPPYGRRTSDVRALWVAANPSALHTDHMTGTTTVATFVRGAVGFIDMSFVSVLPRAVTVSSIATAPLNTK